MFSLRRGRRDAPRACARALVSPSGIIIIDEMTLRAGQRGLYRALAIASGDAKERTQKARMRYARGSQRLPTRTTASVDASATSMNINYSDRDEMPRTPAPFLTQLVAPPLDRCRLQQPICEFARGLCLRSKGSLPLRPARLPDTFIPIISDKIFMTVLISRVIN